MPEGHPFRAIKAQSAGADAAGALDPRELRLRRAARRAFRPPYAFAYFFTDGRGCDEALALYRRNYRPSKRHPVAASNDLRLGARRRHRGRGAALADDARILARGLRARRSALRWSNRTKPPRYPYSDAERSIVDALRRRALVGTADEVATRLTELARRFELDELVDRHAGRSTRSRGISSYELLADAFGLADCLAITESHART